MKNTLSLKLKNKLTLTLSLKQQITILTLQKVEIEELIRNELEENPFLEEEINIIKNDIDYEPKYDYYEDDEEKDNPLNRIAYQPSFLDFISSQIDLEFDDNEKEIAYEIVGNLNEKGFLDTPIKEIAEKFKVDEEIVENIRKRITRLEPAGIASLNIKEALIVQYEERFGEDQIIKDIINQDLEHITDIDYLKKKYKDEKIEEKIQLIKLLNPYPLSNFSSENTIYVEPDIFIYERTPTDGNPEEFEIVINEKNIPKLKFVNSYKKALNNKNINPQTKQFLYTKLQQAIGIVKGLQQRREELYKLAKILVNHQKDFLKYGKEHIKPLTLKDVAKEMDLHESTISRIVSSKYAQTPQGFLPLKAFFSTKLNTESGNISPESVKYLIQKLIEEEDKSNPLSDTQIAQILQEKGIKVARRTVAKYREEMNIPDSRKRKVIT
ncbi:RNA polymerase factor sigma-54 [Venenivibrio stagnispumantis]|uniref:RNA polymerase, sigma 54 subunit, RpoN/SigL n=1 Tax=Venenivibrio stagnispumantis TaxID=407998 RepID=A0AA46AEW3_9AQUI|nr:RNA polymerase factor sigma-54 [Venenivibrio stagnispumantis]MCW4573704.1 RNA polymerase factor sigma-54 [Venenivibrio stagnispumantis]SMP16069.1 RNA polymerase, sigma 54 subunit, RpoN/SigL [Venenivibrio stagnispumantis]